MLADGAANELRPRTRATGTYLLGDATRAALTVTLALGTALRFVHLGRESYWLDEGFALDLARRSPSNLIATLTNVDHPPLYFLLLHWWTDVFGTSEFSARSLSALFGAATILVVYAVGADLFGRGAGLAAAVLAAVAPIGLVNSQDARNYSLLALLTGLSYLFLAKAMRRWSPWLGAGYVTASAAMLYTHLYGALTLLAQAAFLLGSLAWAAAHGGPWKREAVRWASLLAAVVLLFAPWLAAMAARGSMIAGAVGSNSDHLPVPPAHELVGFLSGYAGSRWVLLVLLCAGVLGVLSRRRPPGDALALVTLWTVVPAVVALAGSRVVTPFYELKYTIGASLGLFLLAGLAIASLRPRILLLGALALLAPLAAVNARDALASHKEQWRQAAAYVDTRAARGDLVIFDAPFVQVPFDHYSTRPDLELQPGPWGPDEGVGTVSETRALQAAQRIRPRVWLVVSHSHDARGSVERRLRPLYARRSARHFRGIEVVLLVPRRA